MDTVDTYLDAYTPKQLRAIAKRSGEEVEGITKAIAAIEEARLALTEAGWTTGRWAWDALNKADNELRHDLRVVSVTFDLASGALAQID